VEKIVPRHYQKQPIRAARQALKKTGRALVVLATGLGKMLTSALVWHGFTRGRGLFLVHNNGILEHALKEYRRVYGENERFALFNAYSKDVKGADAVFATFQTMRRNLKRFPRNYFKWMTVDETHHSQATTYRPVIEHFSCPRLGITATPDREDLLDIRELFGEEVVNVTLEEAIARGWLPPIEYHLVTDDGFDEKALKRLAHEVLEEGERLSLEELNRRIFIKARDEKVARIIEKHGMKTIIFCRNITHAEHFKKFLKSAEVYHSRKMPEENRQVLDNLRSGKTRRVLAVNAFNEGIDVPDVGLVVFYRATESETIFRQQLGRGLRPGEDKKKLVVLDFVGNVERIQALRAMADAVAKFHEEHTTAKERAREGYARDAFHLSGKGFEFTFADKVVDLMKVIDRVKTEFYPTWQEASRAALALGIKTSQDYLYEKRMYKKDSRLPSEPHGFYSDFPGWTTFLGKEEKIFYPTWQQASKAAIKVGIKKRDEYPKKYKKDSRLPSTPGRHYKDFPDWKTFLGKPPEDFYPRWQEAREAVLALGIDSPGKYKKSYKKDPRLHSNPNAFYANFPGWTTFLGRKPKKFYKTWKEARTAVKKLGIKTFGDYRERFKKDPRLPSNPHSFYPDFPGYAAFLGNNKSR